MKCSWGKEGVTATGGPPEPYGAQVFCLLFVQSFLLFEITDKILAYYQM